jgi:cytochrome c peroxidase
MIHGKKRWLQAVSGSVFLTLMAGIGVVVAEDSDRQRYSALFGALPADMATAERPMTPERIELGRFLFFDPRLSKSQTISCNSCHRLDRHGVDGEATSLGHKGQRGNRNSPTVMNAGMHVAQFWDGRATDLEEQAKGPILNPVEMAMPTEDSVVSLLKSIPGYPPLFAVAFPDDSDPVTYNNMAIAIGAFERGLVTPSAFDEYLAGDSSRLSPAARTGLEKFVSLGCVTCHNGPAFGGGLYRQLGQVHAYSTSDVGRFAVTGEETDRRVFKVPALRNVTQTGPWFHDGSVTELDEAIRLMGWHQLGIEIEPGDRAQLIVFLETLEGQPDSAYIAMPAVLESGPDTPGPE